VLDSFLARIFEIYLRRESYWFFKDIKEEEEVARKDCYYYYPISCLPTKLHSLV